MIADDYYKEHGLLSQQPFYILGKFEVEGFRRRMMPTRSATPSLGHVAGGVRAVENVEDEVARFGEEADEKHYRKTEADRITPRQNHGKTSAGHATQRHSDDSVLP